MTSAPHDGDGPIVPRTNPAADVAEPAERVIELAASYLARVARGEEPDVDIEAGTLADDLLREQFRRLIDDARTVQDLLPVQVRPGMILSGRYRVGDQIGWGGMGRVYEAFDRRLERRVALKVLAIPAASSFDAHQQFRREAVLLAGLQHPNIVAVHEIATEGDVNYIVMNLVRGTPLDEVLERARQKLNAGGGRPPGLLRDALGSKASVEERGLADESNWHRAVARIVREAASTVEAAHAAGVVHRDIKPKNVMLRADGSPVLLDFGLAGALDGAAGDMAQGLFGTTSYLAPEQASSGHVGSDPRSDVYQLGVLLHELLTLRRAFEGTVPSDVLHQISRGDCQHPRAVDRSIPVDLEAICLRAMELDVKRRYQSARALREDLDRWLGGVELPLAARGGRLARIVRGSRYAIRRHKVAAAACAALSLGALLGAFAWVGGGGEPWTINPFRFRSSTGKTTYGSDIVSVSPGDRLGVVIDTSEPLYVYVISTFGQRSPPTWLAPMSLQVADFQPLGGDEQRPEYHPFGGTLQSALRIPPGSTRIVCTDIQALDPADRFEGLWVFTSREPHASLESWIDVLDFEARKTNHGVEYETARLLYARAQSGPDVSPTRGGSPAPLSAQQRSIIADSVEAAMLLGESEWPFEDSRRWSEVWPVEP